MQCPHQPREWIAQWLPGDERVSLYRPGYHIRGFLAAKVCSACVDALRRGQHITLWHRGEPYIANNITIERSPF